MTKSTRKVLLNVTLLIGLILIALTFMSCSKDDDNVVCNNLVKITEDSNSFGTTYVYHLQDGRTIRNGKKDAYNYSECYN